ncbi:MAG: tetratricopeptide repeat protein [Pyrinomonadaceae bacterium]
MLFLTSFTKRLFQLRSILAAALVTTLLFVAAANAQDEPVASPAERAIEFFNSGQESHEKGDLQKALALYDDAIRVMPEFPEAHYQRGAALLALGRLPEAESAYRRASELRPEWTLPLAALGDLLTRLGKYKDADETLARAIELDPQNLPAFVALANLRLRSAGDRPALIDLLARLRNFTAKASPTAALWVARSRIEARLGDLASARASVASALEIDPRSRDALFQKAEIAIASGDIALADAIAASIAPAKGQDDDLTILKTKAAVAAGRDDEAAALLSKVGRSDAETNSIRALLDTRRATSPEDLELRLKDDPTNAVILGRLCALYRTSDPARSLDYCLRASRAEPDKIQHAVGYGAALVQARRYDEAISLLRRLADAAPDNYTIRANLATALFQSKQYAPAAAEFRWLSSRQPDIAITYFFLAICHDQLGEYLDAMANYQQFLKRADQEKHKLEIEKVDLRLPALQKLVKNAKGKGSAG